MLIVCPNCATPYEVNTSEIGGGRTTRCVRCKNVWFAEPPADVPALRVPETPEQTAESGARAAAEPASDEAVATFRTALGTESAAPERQLSAEDSAAAEVASPPTAADLPPAEPPLNDATGSSPQEAAPEAPTAPDADTAANEATESPAPAPAELSIPVEVAPPLSLAVDQDGSMPPFTDSTAIDGDRDDIETVAARRRARARANKRHTVPRPRLPIVILALVVACAALLGWRKDMVRQLPQLASFYASIGLPVNLRGLAFTDVKVSSRTHDGVPVLVVEGVIASTVSTPVEVPRLRFALRNAAGAEVYSWTAVPAQSVLKPGKTLPFRSRLAAPPKDGHDVQVRFFTHRDTVAGLH